MKSNPASKTVYIDISNKVAPFINLRVLFMRSFGSNNKFI